MKTENQTLRDQNEIAQLAMLLSVALDSGLGLVAAIDLVMPRATGRIAERFHNLLKALNLGGNLYDELSELRGKSAALDELAIKLQVAFQFGSPLSDQLRQLSKSNRALVAQQQYVQAAKRENLMLLPLVFLILPVTVFFAVFPSIQYLNLNF